MALGKVIGPIELFKNNRTGAAYAMTKWTPHSAQRRRLLPGGTFITISVTTTPQIGHCISGIRWTCRPSRWNFWRYQRFIGPGHIIPDKSELEIVLATLKVRSGISQHATVACPTAIDI